MLSILRSKRGVGLVDLLVTVFLLGVAGAIFSATLPSGFRCSRQAQDYKIATAIAQRKMEQMRSMGYESLTQPLLRSAGAIDISPDHSPYSFTSTDGLAQQLTGGSGELAVEDVSDTLKEVRITVSWDGQGGSSRSVRLVGMFANRRPRRL